MKKGKNEVTKKTKYKQKINNKWRKYDRKAMDEKIQKKLN
jgi:hypothetical protein